MPTSPLKIVLCWLYSSLVFFLYYVFLFLYLFTLNHFSFCSHEWFFSSRRRTLRLLVCVKTCFIFPLTWTFFGQVYSSWVIIFFLKKILNIAQLSLALIVTGVINDANLEHYYSVGFNVYFGIQKSGISILVSIFFLNVSCRREKK